MINYKLLKIDSYWIIVNNKEPEDRKFCVSYHKSDKSPILDFYYQGDPYVYPVSSIIASNHPKTNNWFPSITFSDEVAKELGIADIETFAKDRATKLFPKGESNANWRRCVEDFLMGYKFFNNKDKLFTLEQMKYCFEAARETSGMNMRNQFRKKYKTFDDYIQSLTKQEYDCSGELQENTFLVTKIIKK